MSTVSRVKENNSEFKTALEYTKPDIICDRELWLGGKKKTTTKKNKKKKKKLENNMAKNTILAQIFFRTVSAFLEMIEALEGTEFLLLFDQKYKWKYPGNAKNTKHSPP